MRACWIARVPLASRSGGCDPWRGKNSISQTEAQPSNTTTNRSTRSRDTHLPINPSPPKAGYAAGPRPVHPGWYPRTCDERRLTPLARQNSLEDGGRALPRPRSGAWMTTFFRYRGLAFALLATAILGRGAGAQDLK